MRCISLVLVLVCAGGQAPAMSDRPQDSPAMPGPDMPGFPVTGEQMDRLRGAEVLLANIRTDESGGAAMSRALFHAPVENIWAQLMSCEEAFKYVDGLQDCEEIEQGPERARLKQSVKKSWVVPRMDFTVEFLRQPYSRIDFRKIEGDLELLEGSWLFNVMPGSDEVLVTHEIRVKPKIPVPRWLVRRSIRKDIPDMLACLRFLAGGSGGDEQRAADRDRCPRTGRDEG